MSAMKKYLSICSRHCNCSIHIRQCLSFSCKLARFPAASTCLPEGSLWLLEPSLPGCRANWMHQRSKAFPESSPPLIADVSCG